MTNDTFHTEQDPGFHGGIIILETGEKDYMLSEIAGIVESNNARIVSLKVTRVPETSGYEINMRLDRPDIAPILQTFYRYNYQVRYSWSPEESERLDLKERYDALMNYLNI